MEEIGNKLATARKEKGYSVDQVARDTNIAKRYISALESEDFSEFPGEPYLIGFLRNYADYLGLDPNDMVTLYKNFKIQEQPVPINELIVKKGFPPIVKILGVLVIVAVVVFGAIFLYPVIKTALEDMRIEAAEVAEDAVEAGTVYTLNDEFIETRFIQGDEIRIPVDNSIRSIRLVSITDEILIKTPETELILKLGEEKSLDLDGNPGADIKIFVRDIDSRANASVLRFDKLIQAPVSIVSTETDSASTSEVSDSDLVIVTPVEGSGQIGSRIREIVTIKESDSTHPFNLDVLFNSYCYFRYAIDDLDKEAKFFHKNERFKQEVNTKIHLWVSNAAAFSITVAGRKVEFGNPGEVASKLIGWVKDEDTGKFQLKIIPVY